MYEDDTDSSVRTWAMFCHLSLFSGYILPCGGLVVPLVLWLMKKDESPYIDHHGREALNFLIAFTCVNLANVALCITVIWIPVAILVGIVLAAVGIALPIIAAIKANDGEHYRYPYIFRLL